MEPTFRVHGSDKFAHMGMYSDFIENAPIGSDLRCQLPRVVSRETKLLQLLYAFYAWQLRPAKHNLAQHEVESLRQVHEEDGNGKLVGRCVIHHRAKEVGCEIGPFLLYGSSLRLWDVPVIGLVDRVVEERRANLPHVVADE